MSLLSSIQQLRDAAVAADDQDKVRSRSGEFAALRERLELAIANAAEVAAGRAELAAAGIVQSDYDQERAETLDAVRVLQDFVEELAISAPFDSAKLPGRSVESHFKKSTKFVADEWKARVSADPPTANDDLLDALQRGGVDVESIRSGIEGAKVSVNVLRARIIPKPGDNSRLEAALQTIRSSAERIGEVVDPSIADVIVRAQRGGVPWSEMSPAVTSELTRLGILGRFKVVLR